MSNLINDEKKSWEIFLKTLELYVSVNENSNQQVKDTIKNKFLLSLSKYKALHEKRLKYELSILKGPK